MNFLVGLLLLVMPEERAFWVLCFIVEDLLQDYFVRRYELSLWLVLDEEELAFALASHIWPWW